MQLQELVYLVLFIIALVLIYRLVKATERIGDVIEHYRLNREKEKNDTSF